MDEWQARVIKESTDLDNKIKKLNGFITQQSVGTIDRILLSQQLDAMLQYYNVLRIRIALFDKE